MTKLWLQLRPALLLWALLFAFNLASPPTFAYDGREQAKVVYDALGKSPLAYDAASTFATNKEQNGARGHRLLFAGFAEFLAAETGATPFAMGLKGELGAFAEARGATTWKQFPNPETWKSGVLDKLADPNTPVHFNLNGVGVWGGVQRAASGAGGATDWELLQIRQNPQFWDSMTFWKNGQVAPNPFK